MNLFGVKNKKSDNNVRPLTETEIQKRLYGHLRSPSTTVDDLGSPAPRQTTVSSSTVKRPAETSKDPFHSKTDSSLDTFKKQSESTRTVQEKKVKPQRSARRPNLFFAALRAVLNVSKSVLFFILTIFFRALAAILKFIFSIDFRKPRVRRAATFLGAAAFIGALFVSTNLLNVKREAAMKFPIHRRFVNKPAKKLIAQPAQNPSGEAAPNPSTSNVVPPSPQDVVSPSVPTAANSKLASPSSYSIQIATFATREDAGRLVEKLKEQNAEAFIKSLERPGGRTYYCVFVGRYKTSREAEESLAQFKKKTLAKPFQDAFIRVLKAETA